MTPALPDILARADAGHPVADIAAAVGLHQGRVYAILREHRPDRPRKPRRRTSAKRRLILGLISQGIAVPRVAFLADCTSAYVYRIVSGG